MAFTASWRRLEERQFVWELDSLRNSGANPNCMRARWISRKAIPNRLRGTAPSSVHPRPNPCVCRPQRGRPRWHSPDPPHAGDPRGGPAALKIRWAWTPAALRAGLGQPGKIGITNFRVARTPWPILPERVRRHFTALGAGITPIYLRSAARSVAEHLNGAFSAGRETSPALPSAAATRWRGGSVKLPARSIAFPR